MTSLKAIIALQTALARKDRPQSRACGYAFSVHMNGTLEPSAGGEALGV
jgi:hypothetical protein